MKKTRSSTRPPSLPNLLLQAASEAELLLDDRAVPYARILEQGRPRLLRLRSREFRLWLAGRGHDLFGQVPGTAALTAAMLQLEDRARRAPRVVLWNRVARCPDGALWLDLGDGRAVRVTAGGFAVIDDPPPLFRRFTHQEALPTPAASGDLRRMDAFLNLQDEDDTILFYVSLVAALICDIPQPLLILHGPQGAAKTTTARLRRRLIDPSRVATVLVRRELGELVQALDHHYMPILDNLSGLSTWQEEVLCQTATGGAFTKRALFSDQEDVLFHFYRPAMLTGINLPSAAPDLLDRAVLIGLERIEPSARRGERALWHEFDAQRPALLAGLLGVLAEAMRIEPELELGELLRMADFCRWGAAAAEVLGFGAERFLEALRRNAVKQSEEVVEDDPLAEAVQELVGQGGRFAGSSTELLAALLKGASAQRQSGMPRSPVDLGRRLTRLQAPLAELGIVIRTKRLAAGRSWIVQGAAADREARSVGPSADAAGEHAAAP